MKSNSTTTTALAGIVTLLLIIISVAPCIAGQPDRNSLYGNCLMEAEDFLYRQNKPGDEKLRNELIQNCLQRKALKQASGGAPASACSGGVLKPNYDIKGKKFVSESMTDPPDLHINGEKCTVVSEVGKKHVYRFVNIYGSDDKSGELVFEDGKSRGDTGPVHFWAKSILVENNGILEIGKDETPISNRTVTIHLYGAATGKEAKEAITCATTTSSGDKICGVPKDSWQLTGHDKFYAYDRLPTDDDRGDKLDTNAYFGRKTIAVSFGGSLKMFGAKGLKKGAGEADSGFSWTRLAKTVDKGATVLSLNKYVDWAEGDYIAITPTDYLPGHAETLKVKANKTNEAGLSEITLDTDTYTIKYRHNGEKYKIDDEEAKKILARPGGATRDSIETRAAVALLSRSVRIVSNLDYKHENDEVLPNNNSEKPGDEDSYFGGHIIARQGFKAFQMQGVELFQMGQGGRMAHVPINFYRAGKIPEKVTAEVKDCSIWDSMNHWIELRATHNVRLERNVGYKSIGHGYVIADGSEINNYLISNIGIYARPGADYRDNPRKVPGVLAQKNSFKGDLYTTLAYGGDLYHPSPFFITNAYNTLEHNMAAGTGACGSCFWYAPAAQGFFSNMSFDDEMAKIQESKAGTAVIKSFSGNFCSTSMYSLLTVGDVGACLGISPRPKTEDSHLREINNRFSKTYASNGENADPAFVPQNPDLVPRISSTGLLNATIYPTNPRRNDTPDCNKKDTRNCAVNVIDSYTSSFHWSEINFSAIWLRQNWFLFTDSALTDVQNGGLTMVSGGSYDQVPAGYWALTRRSVFVGKTQNDNDYATEAGPRLSKTTGLSCKGNDAAYCLLENEGISFPTGNFNNYQRLINIYDGPVYLKSNVFMDIKKTTLMPQDNCKPGKGKYACDKSGLMYGGERAMPIPVDDCNESDNSKCACILTNAAIGWKQPNAFYYPPAFHMSNLYFKNVDIRHFVIVPPFKPGTMETDPVKLKKNYCSYSDDIFTSWTDIDRQTEINDDDGSLSGVISSEKNILKGSISVNNDEFYRTPSQAFECRSEKSCLQSPYDHLNIAVMPNCVGKHDKVLDKCKGDCMAGKLTDFDKINPTPYACKEFCEKKYADTVCNDRKQLGAWDAECQNQKCAGVPIYRQYLIAGEPKSDKQGIRMMGSGISQRSVMIANNGKYFIETTKEDEKWVGNNERRLSNFVSGQAYNFFMIYAKGATNVTYQLFVGKNREENDVFDKLKMVRVGSVSIINDNRGNPVEEGPRVLSSPFEFNASKWPDTMEKARSYKKDTGILEIRMDMNNFKGDFEKSVEESCRPASYCTWNKDKGKCEPASSGKIINFTDDDHRNTCGEWAVKASECPSGGCIGFQITFPEDYDDQKKKLLEAKTDIRPEPELFPADWNNGAKLSVSPNTGGKDCEKPDLKMPDIN